MAQQESGGLRDWIGFPLKAIPLVSLLGLLVAMASVPQFFRVASRRYGDDSSWGSSVVDVTLKWLAKAARELSGWIASPTVANNLDVITEVALIAVVLLLPAALIRSVRESSVLPAALTASGFFAGLIALPVTIWLVILVWYLYRLGVWLLGIAQIVADWLAGVMVWLAPYLAVIVVLAAIGAVVYALFQASMLLRVIAASAGVVIVVALFTDLFDPVLVWLGEVLEPVVAFLGKVLGWVAIGLTYVFTVFVYAVIVLAVLGLIVALFGTIGRVSVLSVTGAWESGRGAQKITDLSAGVGLTVGTVVLAASMERAPGEFGPWLEYTWSATPVIGYIPSPVGLMDLMVPDMAERYLVTYFTGFYPAIDVLLLVVVCLIGVLSLALRAEPWEQDDGQKFRLAFPILMAIGLALALALPLIVMSLIADEGG